MASVGWDAYATKLMSARPLYAGRVKTTFYDANDHSRFGDQREHWWASWKRS